MPVSAPHSEAEMAAVKDVLDGAVRGLLARGIALDAVMHGMAAALAMACLNASDRPREALAGYTEFAEAVLSADPAPRQIN